MGRKSGLVLTAVVLVVALAQYFPETVGQDSPPVDACTGVNCQQGTCKLEGLGYACKCQEGWENILDFPFLPCGIPKDCNINLSCDENDGSPIPSPQATSSFQWPDFTAFNPCTLSVCGFGKCVEDENPGLLTVPYSCVCDPGNSNVLNMSSGTCLPNCSFGGSCSQLNLPLTKSPPPPPPASTITNPANGAGKKSRDVVILLASAIVGVATWLVM